MCVFRPLWRAYLCVPFFALTLSWAQTSAPVTVNVGSLPRGVAIDPVSNVALVGNFGDSTVSFIDLATQKVIGTLSVSSPSGVAVSAGNGTAVVTSRFDNSVTVIDVNKRSILGVVGVGSGPVGVAVNPVTNIAVVANSLGNSVSLVDLRGLKVVTEITGIPNATGLQSVAVDLNQNIAAVASSTSNSLIIVDLAAKTIRATIPVEQSPSGVAIDIASKTAAVTNEFSNSVSLVDLTTNTVRASVPNIPRPQAVAMSAGTKSAIVTTGTNGTIEVVNLLAAAVDVSIPNLANPTGVAYNPTNGRTVVSFPNDSSVGVISSLGLFVVVHGSTFAQGAVAPLSIAAGFGTGLSSKVQSAVPPLPLPTSLNNTIVRVSGSNVPLFFVSAQQINFQVPAVSPGNYPIQVLYNGVIVGSGTLIVAAVAPGFFTANQQGTGQVVAVNSNGSLNNPAPPPGVPFGNGSPANAGDYITLYGTGGGITNPSTPAGSAPTAAAKTTFTPTAQIGGIAATVLYSGTAPSLVGVWQVNVVIPATVKSGSDIAVVLTENGQTTPTVTIAVR